MEWVAFTWPSDLSCWIRPFGGLVMTVLSWLSKQCHSISVDGIWQSTLEWWLLFVTLQLCLWTKALLRMELWDMSPVSLLLRTEMSLQCPCLQSLSMDLSQKCHVRWTACQKHSNGAIMEQSRTYDWYYQPFPTLSHDPYSSHSKELIYDWIPQAIDLLCI